MRRFTARCVPLLALALLVQLLAPLGALHKAVAQAGDPLAMAVLCSGAMPDGAGHAAPDQHCCAYCGIAHQAAVDPAAPSSHHVVIQRLYHRVVWLAPTAAPIRVHVAGSAQARAPPVLS